MKSWRWWLSIGSIPLWIAALECAWAAANAFASSRISREIREAQKIGVLYPVGPEDEEPLPVQAFGPYVQACQWTGRPPDEHDSAHRFAFEWDRPPERVWVPLMRGWVRANTDALREIRNGASEKLPWGIEGPIDEYGPSVAIKLRFTLALAFSAARLSRIDGSEDASQRLSDAIRFFRCCADRSGPPCDFYRTQGIDGVLGVVTTLLETGDPAIRQPGILETLAGLDPGMFRREAIRAARLNARSDFLTSVNDVGSFGIRCLQVGSNTGEVTPESLRYRRLGEINDFFGDTGLQNPILRYYLVDELRAWLAVARTGMQEDDAYSLEVQGSEVWTGLLVAVARAAGFAKDGRPSPAEIFAGLAPELSGRLRLAEDSGGLTLTADGWERRTGRVLTPRTRSVRIPR